MKTIRFTTYWTAAEADTVYQFLDDLKIAIWQAYGDEIEEMYREIAEESKESKPFDDDLPF